MTDSPSDTSEETVPPVNPVLIDAWNKAVDLVEQLVIFWVKAWVQRRYLP